MIESNYTGGDTIIVLYQDKEREFIVAHNVNIKLVAYIYKNLFEIY